MDDIGAIPCPRCEGTGKQKTDNTRKGRIGSIGGTKLYNLRAGKCTLCDGVGKVKVG